jgi:hypothetical protein
MSRRLVLAVCAASLLFAAPLADAGGPSVGPVQDGPGLSSPGGLSTYFAVGVGDKTVLEKVETSTNVMQKSILAGAWGITNVTLRGNAGGLSQDGKTLVLASMRAGSPSRFLVVNALTLKPIKRVALKGSFAYDALSPDGSKLYLIQHTAANDRTHYVVRSYNLRANRLLGGRIADKTQQNWVMQGSAMTRAAGPGSRWVYTLYQNPGGYPFVHALDTVAGIAHCTGLPWTGSQDKLWNIELTVRDSGKTLAVHWNDGRPWLEVDTTNWTITHLAPRG